MGDQRVAVSVKVVVFLKSLSLRLWCSGVVRPVFPALPPPRRRSESLRSFLGATDADGDGAPGTKTRVNASLVGGAYSMRMKP